MSSKKAKKSFQLMSRPAEGTVRDNEFEKTINNHQDTFTSRNIKPLDETRLDSLIRQKAYSLWEAKGQLEGEDIDTWLQARKEIIAQLK